jgi:hypothetical protein
MLSATALAAIGGACVVNAAFAAPSSQFLGTWAGDHSTLTPIAGLPVPKSIMVTITDIGGGKWSMTTKVVTSDGRIVAREPLSLAVDGPPTPVLDNPGSMVVTSSPDANTLILTQTKGGTVVEKTTLKLSAGGKRQVETSETTGPHGSPIRLTTILNRK